MNDCLLDEQLFNDFCKHVSASLNAVDLVRTTCAFESPAFDHAKDDPILLTAPDLEKIESLHQLNYLGFLQECVRRLRLLPSCSDVFLSEVDEATFKDFQNGMEYYGPRIVVERVENGYKIHLPALISDLVLPVIARVHEEVMHTFDHFTGMIEAVGGDPSRLFLNAKSSTPESQFILFWVATKLGVPARPTDETVVVI